MNNPLEQFREAIAAAGLTAPDVIYDDGAIHRFSTNGRRGDDSGWYVSYTDGTPSGAFGCWRTGLQLTWCSRSDSEMTRTELDDHRRCVKAAQIQRETEEAARQKKEAGKAVTRWNMASVNCQHPYLTSKGIQAHGIKQDGDALLVPMRDTAGTLHSLQTITRDGDKRFRGRMKGCYHAIGKPTGRIVVCEGYATGASIHEATGEAVAVAFNAGNVTRVATALHKKYPDLTIIVAADDDWHTEGNPGMAAAKSAALAVGGFVVSPHFPANRPVKATDFNDLATLLGPAAVRACFSEMVRIVC